MPIPDRHAGAADVVAATLLCALTLSGCRGSDGGGTAEPVPLPAPPAANRAGVATISCASALCDVLTADLQDPDGLQNAIPTYQWTSDGLNIAGATSTFTYQWQADGVDIVGAEASALRLTTAQLDVTIRVRVTYTDDKGGATDSGIAQTITIEPNTHYTLSAFTRAPARLGVGLKVWSRIRPRITPGTSDPV